MSWRRGNHNQQAINRVRIRFLAVFFIVFAAIIVVKLFGLQILRGNFYSALALGQHELYQKLFPERGSIYVREKDGDKEKLFPVVTNQDLYMLYAVPAEITDASSTAKSLLDIFGLQEEVDWQKVEPEMLADVATSTEPKLAAEIKANRKRKWLEEQKNKELEKFFNILNKGNDPYEPVYHRVSEEQKKKIEELRLVGLYFKEETWRFYPEKGLGGHLFGFWGFAGDERSGLYGLEGYYNDLLSGQAGAIYSEKDALGNLIAVGRNSLVEKTDGADLVLTLDRAIQYKACLALKQAVDYFEAKGGAVVVINPKTGAILAMCGAPDYDPDKYNQTEKIESYNNPAIFQAYEPGSIFKVITMAAALDSGQVEPNTTYVDEGEVVYDKYHIKNFDDKIYGRQNMTEVLEKSINTGAIFAMRQATPKVFIQYVKNFGFGEKTGIGLEKEVAGSVANLDKRGEIYAATAAFGQGIMVTPLQMVAAVSAIANGGKLMKPYLVAEIIHHHGSERQTQKFYPQEVRSVIFPKTATMLSGMMVSAVENGHGKKAGVAGYRVAGKTGTAQIAGAGGSYSGEVFTSFVGFAPFADPRFAMIVALDSPAKGREAAVIAAPVFGDIAKFILQYYNVPYDNKK